MLTKPSLVFTSLARAGTDLDFKPHVILSFGRSVNSAWLKGKQSTKTLGSRKTKFSLVYIFLCASQGQTSSLNKTNIEFFNEALRKTRSTCWLIVRWNHCNSWVSGTDWYKRNDNHNRCNGLPKKSARKKSRLCSFFERKSKHDTRSRKRLFLYGWKGAAKYGFIKSEKECNSDHGRIENRQFRQTVLRLL